MPNDLLLMQKRIDLDASPILYDRPCSQDSFAEDWQTRNAQWEYRDGAFWGRNPLPAPGVIFSKRSFPGDVLVDCYARTVLPSRHDIDVMWNMTWDEAGSMRGPAYVAGIQGWWEGKVGIEKSPRIQAHRRRALPLVRGGPRISCPGRQHRRTLLPVRQFHPAPGAHRSQPHQFRPPYPGRLRGLPEHDRHPPHPRPPDRLDPARNGLCARILVDLIRGVFSFFAAFERSTTAQMPRKTKTLPIKFYSQSSMNFWNHDRVELDEAVSRPAPSSRKGSSWKNCCISSRLSPRASTIPPTLRHLRT